MRALDEIIADLLSAIKNRNSSLSVLKADAAEIKAKYDPTILARTQFNAWCKCHEGKIFKQKLYNRQKGQCANPECQLKGQILPIDYLEIDHKLPISTHPHLALTKRNLHLLCTPCNRKKSSRI